MYAYVYLYFKLWKVRILFIYVKIVDVHIIPVYQHRQHGAVSDGKMLASFCFIFYS